MGNSESLEYSQAPNQCVLFPLSSFSIDYELDNQRELVFRNEYLLNWHRKKRWHKAFPPNQRHIALHMLVSPLESRLRFRKHVWLKGNSWLLVICSPSFPSHSLHECVALRCKYSS